MRASLPSVSAFGDYGTVGKNGGADKDGGSPRGGGPRIALYEVSAVESVRLVPAPAGWHGQRGSERIPCGDDLSARFPMARRGAFPG